MKTATPLLVAASLLLALAACTQRGPSAQQPAVPVAAQAPKASLEEILKKTGLEVPTATLMSEDFTLQTLDGKKVSLSSFKGSVVLLSFWATWCGPCKQEMPEMQVLYDQLKARGLTIVAVDVMEDRDTVSAFLRQNKYTFPVLLDVDGKVGGSSLYGVSAIPTNYVLDRKGRIVARAVGIGGPTWTSSERRDLFEKLLAM
jgi:thiol-disulfide isomerase/thioredoxin